MDNLIDVLIPVDAAAAKALESAEERLEIGRYVSELMRRRRAQSRVMRAIADLKQEAHANGLTDDQVDEELKAWRTERHA